MSEPLSRDIPQGRGSGLDADRLGGKGVESFHCSDKHNHMKPLDEPQTPTLGLHLYSRVVAGKTELAVKFPDGSIHTLVSE